MNFANHVDGAARDAPEKTALSDPERSVTFEQFATETSRFANAVAELGVAAGDRVAIYLPNGIPFVTAYFGAMKRGAIPLPVNMRFGGQEIEYVLEDAGASAVVTSGRFEDMLDDVEVVALDHRIVVDGESGHDYDDLLASADDERTVYPRKEAELADLMYTSGTTGRPKGVKHTHRNLSTNARGLVKYVEWSEHETGLTVCPCFHVSGLHITVTPFMLAGATNHLLPSWDPATTLETIADREVSYVFCIPTMVIDLLNFDGHDEYDTSSLGVIGVGGAPMPKERIEATEAAFDCELLEGYGMTETTPLAAINLPGPDVTRKPGSVGQPTREVVDLRVENPETGREVAREEKGEVLWHGDTVTPGYFNDPERNEAAFVEREGKRWLYSGDIGRLDAEGHLFIEDRVDDMIITGGENVYPREVEDVLYGIDGLAEAAVIDTPDDRLGQSVTAVVVPADGSLSADRIEGTVREHLADYKIPRRIEFVDELPKTSTRKTDKVALRERFH